MLALPELPELSEDHEFFSTLDDMFPGRAPKSAGWLKPEQIATARVTLETNVLTQEIRDKVAKNAELTAISCRNSILTVLDRMPNVPLSKFGGRLAFWRTGVVALVIVSETHQVMAKDEQAATLTFNLDAVDAAVPDPICCLF